MRDYRDAKAMAQSLRQALDARSITITHSDSLELIAKSFGFDNWNILAAKIGDGGAPASSDAPTEAPTVPPTLYCSFCGKSHHDVKRLIAGPNSFICDECIGICARVLDDPPQPPPSSPDMRHIGQMVVAGATPGEAVEALQAIGAFGLLDPTKAWFVRVNEMPGVCLAVEIDGGAVRVIHIPATEQYAEMDRLPRHSPG